MYDIVRGELKDLTKYEMCDCKSTVFNTYKWIQFLRNNQKIEPVLLRVEENGELCAIFLGLIIKKAGMRILGSPFEGWLTCDMGFIHIKTFDISAALKSVASYAFKKLNCWYFQITDKQIHLEDLDDSVHYYMSKTVFIDNSRPLEEVLASFTKNGRRDVRASERKGAIVERVPFDKAFMDEYYKQLEDVFDKQGLKPFYSKQKLYDMVEAIGDDREKTLALMAYNPDGIPIATVFSLGYHEWAYYVGAASYRKYQKLLPNELLFWNFIKYWNGAGKTKMDLVGVREYKMKYAPVLIDQPVVYFERFPGIKKLKDFAKECIEIKRILVTKIKDLKTERQHR